MKYIGYDTSSFQGKHRAVVSHTADTATEVTVTSAIVRLLKSLWWECLEIFLPWDWIFEFLLASQRSLLQCDISRTYKSRSTNTLEISSNLSFSWSTQSLNSSKLCDFPIRSRRSKFVRIWDLTNYINNAIQCKQTCRRWWHILKRWPLV